MRRFTHYYFALRSRLDDSALNSRRGALLPLLSAVRSLEAGFWRRQGMRRVDCYGDSHIAELWRLNTRYKNVRFVVNSVRGATALGVANPNSKTNALKIFAGLLRQSVQGGEQLFCLGEVDCGFLIWLLAQKRQESVNQLLGRAVDSYTSFIGQHRSTGQVVVLSAPLPTLADGVVQGEVANLRREVTASRSERTRLTLQFNRRVALWCEAHGVEFIDLDVAALDAQTGLLRASLLNADPANHHYDRDGFFELLANSRFGTRYD